MTTTTRANRSPSRTIPINAFGRRGPSLKGPRLFLRIVLRIFTSKQPKPRPNRHILNRLRKLESLRSVRVLLVAKEILVVSLGWPTTNRGQLRLNFYL